MTTMTDSEGADVLRWLDAQAGDPDANERFRELRDYIARLREPAEAQSCPECHGTGGHFWHEADGSERGDKCGTCDGFGHVYPAWAQAQGGGEIYQAQWRAVYGCPWEDITREEYDALRSVEAVTRIVYLAPPSAPVEVERVARSMAENDGWHVWDTAIGCVDTLSGNTPDEERDHYRDLARVAIAAMSAPPSAPVGVDGLLADLETIWHSVSDDKETSAAYQRLKSALAQQPAAIPRLANCGKYTATDNNGQNYYLNHANTWQTFQGQQPAASRDIGADALQYVFGNMDRLDWARIVGEQLIPPWPLPHHVEAMGMFKQPAAVDESLPDFLDRIAGELVSRDTRAGTFAPGIAESLRGRAIVLRTLAQPGGSDNA